MIRLTDRYGIEVGDCSYILYKIKVSGGDKHKGKEYLTPTGYFTSLGGALNSFRKEVIADNLKGLDIDLSDAISIIKASNDKVEQLIKEAIDERE